MSRSLPVVLLVFLIGCAGLSCSSTGVEPEDDPSDAAALPLLESDIAIGTTLYGRADLSNLGPAERRLLDAAATQGLNGFTYYVDWAELEPEPGQYTLTPFTQRLDALQDLGVQPFVNLTVGDIDDYNLPDDLSDGEGGLADGGSLDDPALIERFGRVLDRVVPLVVERGGFFLGVGNEVDARLDDATQDELDAYVRFVEAARDRVHATDARLAVGVTLTTDAVRTRSRTAQALRDAVDVIPLNYGPIQPDFFVRDLDDIASDFQDVLSGVPSGPILIQELTCPSATTMDASRSWQKSCFERLFEEIAATPRIRFASVFTFQDFDEETCVVIRDFFFGDTLDDLPEDVAQRLTDYLCQLGVVAPDGTPKPAWDALLEGLDTVSG
jgi:hypothetical protein